jgi:hypothetical protein
VSCQPLHTSISYRTQVYLIRYEPVVDEADYQLGNQDGLNSVQLVAARATFNSPQEQHPFGLHMHPAGVLLIAIPYHFKAPYRRLY